MATMFFYMPKLFNKKRDVKKHGRKKQRLDNFWNNSFGDRLVCLILESE